MTTHDLDRIRFVTRHFTELQGLRWLVPWGVFLLVGGFRRILPIYYSGPVFLLSFIGMFCFLTSGKDSLHSYYRLRFGEVEKPTTAFKWQSSPWFYLALILWMGIAFFLHFVFGPCGNAWIPYVIEGLALLGVWTWRGHRSSQSHYLMLAALFFGLAAPASRSVLGENGVNDLLFGTALIVAGLLDHRQLVRTLGHPVTPQMKESS